MAAAQRFSALRLSLKPRKQQISLLNSLLAGNLPGDGFVSHCVASQAVLTSENGTPVSGDPPMAGFRDLADGLQTPNFMKSEANSPKVSAHYHEYSRFRET